MFSQDLLSPLGMGAQNKERPQQIVCYRAWDESGGLDLEKMKERGDLKLAYIFHC